MSVLPKNPPPNARDRERRLEEARRALLRRIESERDVAARLLAEDPELAEDPDAAVDLVYTEYAARIDRGELVDRDELLARHARWRDELVVQLRIHDLMDGSDGASEVPGHPAGPSPRQPGQTIGPYLLLERLSQGAMGTVYKARHETMGRLVALKLLPLGKSAEERAQFIKEARSVARAAHPNIVQIFDVGETATACYFAFEYLEGGTLADRLRQGPFSPRQTAVLVSALARAVAALHEIGIFHCDITPANVLLGSGDTPKLADFGLARFAGKQPGGAGGHELDIQGTPGFMAPEQATGRPTSAATDVHGLGAVAYALLTGRAPFGGETALDTMAQVLTEDAIPPGRLRRGLPEDLDVICLKCLRKDPVARYASAAALADDLDRYLAGEPIRARRAGMGERLWKWCKRSPALAAAVATAGMAVLTVAVGGLWYNARLRSALSRSEAQQRQISSQARRLDQQVQSLRRAIFARHMAEAAGAVAADPGRALALLADEQACPPAMRGLPWRLVYWMARHDEHTLTAHRLPVRALAVSSDGRLVASAALENRIALWDVATGSSQGTIGPMPRTAGAVAFAGPDRIVTHSGTTLMDWDLGGRRAPRSVPDLAAPVSLLAPVPSQGKVIVGLRDGTVGSWDLALGRWTPGAAAGQSNLRAVAVSGDGRLLATTDHASPVRLWRLPGFERIAELPVRSVSALALSPDGRRLAGNVGGGGMWLWDLDRRRLQIEPRLGPEGITALTWVDDRELVAGDNNGDVSVWRVAIGRWEKARTFRGHRNNVAKVEVTGDRIVSGDTAGVVRIWRRSPAEAARPWAWSVTSLVASPDGRTLFAGGNTGEIGVFDSLEQRPMATLEGHERSLLRLAVSPDGKLLVSAGADRTVRAWDPGLRRQRAVLAHGEPVLDARVLSDGAILSRTIDGDVWLWQGWSAPTPRPRKLGSGARRVMLATSTDGRWYALPHGDDIQIWDRASGKRVAQRPAHRVSVVAISPDGRTVAAARLALSRQFVIDLWDVATGAVRTLEGHLQRIVSLDFSADGKTLLSASVGDAKEHGDVKMWDVETGRAWLTLPDQMGPAVILAGDSGIATTDTGTGWIRRWRADPVPP